MDALTSDIRALRGVGDARARALSALGVRTVNDLLSFFPRAYEDRSAVREIASLREGDAAVIRAFVTAEPVLSHIRRGMDILKTHASDDTGAVEITFFNQSYYKSQLHRGETYYFYGKISLFNGKRTMTNPVFEPEDKAGETTLRIVPIYRLTGGLTQRSVQALVRQALDLCADVLPEPLPEDVLSKYQLCRSAYAYENVHFPRDAEALAIARRRLVFEELFTLSCALRLLRTERVGEDGAVVPRADMEEFYSSLPFSPTNAQRRAVGEAMADMSSGRLMNRLVQGDVGSGKTLVAAACVWLAARAGLQSAFMAPTEILAEQHFSTLRSLLEPFGVRVMLLTGSMTAREKRGVLASLATGECTLAVGTHALISEGVEFRRLGLVVTDEQHRFGVSQRSALSGKGEKPHALVMSATPIPRTLALMIYGDLDVSVIDELPPGRQKVDTFAVGESYRSRLCAFIKKIAAEGGQVFDVCPMIEEGEDEATANLKSAEKHAEELRRKLPELRIGCIHGRMKSKEKDAAMADFVSGKTQVLVSTTVVEVGVDVPNACLMIVENAERFGLSQLHQLRGRVGRGSRKSWCVLVSDAKGEEARARLSVMTKTNDGFKIAEEDLRLRGPGDFFGSRQHGLPELHIADLGADMDVLRAAQDAANAVMEKDPELLSPEHVSLHGRVDALIQETGGRFN